MAVLLPHFNVLRPGYGGASVKVFVGETETLANLFYDEAGTQVAPNPITLASTTVNGEVYGRYPQPVYTDATAFHIEVIGLGSGGIHRAALVSVDGKDISGGLITVQSGTAKALKDLIGAVVHTDQYGTLSSSDASANSALITTCIGVVSGRGGGHVVLPAGTWPINALTLPLRTLLRGQGRDVTTLLSTLADSVITMSGDEAGLLDLTLDGESLVANGIGFDADGKNRPRLERARIKRFDLGLKYQSVQNPLHRDLFIENCGTGVRLKDDVTDGPSLGLHWTGGAVEDCTLAGVEFLDENGNGSRFHRLQDIDFVDNFGTAVMVTGGQYIETSGCSFLGNLRHFEIGDALAPTPETPVINIRTRNSRFEGGTIEVNHTAQDVIFEACKFDGMTWDINAPDNAIILEGCIEGSDVVVDGDATRIQRSRRVDEGNTTVRTTNNSDVVIWSFGLENGQAAILEANVVACGLDNEDRGAFKRYARVHRDPGVLAFDNQTANFTLGQVVTGGTSGATGRLVGQSDSGTSGTLSLRQITGSFQNNETITDPLGGSALVNGTLASGAVVVDNSSNEYSTGKDGLTVRIVASADEVQVAVNGLSNKSFEWVAEVQVVTST